MSASTGLRGFKLRRPFPRPFRGSGLSGAGRAGPRRLAIGAAVVVFFAAVVVIVSFSGRQAPPASLSARMTPMDPLPGGLHSTPEQDQLARVAEGFQADAAAQKGASYTPALAPSVPFVASTPKAEQPDPQPAAAQPSASRTARVGGATGAGGAPTPQPRYAGRPQRPVGPVALATFAPDPAPLAKAAPAPAQVIPVASQDPQAEQQLYTRQIGDLFNQWGGRAPRTDVVMPQDEADPPSDASTERRSGPSTQRSGRPEAPAVVPAASRPDAGQILIPAGRGIFAHPILAVSSDQSSPIVMQADSGPIAGDRMIGTFARQEDRLVVRINTVVHRGESISVDGLVIAPDTMEAGVASEVDQHYLTRFVLPAAAAFVQGLGQALATTSNTTAVLSPLGGATTTTHLNLDQQLGVAAGTSASQIGSALAQAAPKGPTVKLDANVSVGVMFLSPVTTRSQG